ncbi:MAG: AtpZ/AtpI family protein [Thermoguttaceae bacterium]|jgi:F0F1-type ATP synthase assembly protein I
MRPTENDKYGVGSVAEAMKCVSVVTSVVGVMTVPALVGIWIDHLLGTALPFTILGVIFGFVGGMYCLLDMVKAKYGPLIAASIVATRVIVIHQGRRRIKM